MASTFITSNSPYSSLAHLHIHHHHESLFPISKHHIRRSFHLSSSKPNSIKPLRFSLKDEGESDLHSTSSSNSSPVALVDEDEPSVEAHLSGGSEGEGEGEETENQQQELDWKADEEFKKFMGNPSIEAAIKLEKKRADRKLRELDAESSDNPVSRLFSRLARDSLIREKERLEKAEEAFKALDLNKLKGCFGFDTFFATDVRRFGDGGIFIGNLRRPIEEVMPKLEKKLLEAAGREVVVWFMEEKKDDVTKQELSSALKFNNKYMKVSTREDSLIHLEE